MSRIWLVDDSDLEREIARRVLAKKHDVVEFSSGDSALEKISSGALPDILVIDYQLPGLSGLEVTRHVRRTMTTADLPILVLSSTFTNSQDIADGLRAGANDYVLKPFSEIELLARVEALAQAKLQRQRAERAERSLRRLLQYLPDPFLAIDLAGRITFVNREAERILGQEWAALLSQELATVVPALGKVHLQSFSDVPRDLVIGARHFEPAFGRLVLEEEIGETVTVTLRDITDKVLAIDRRDRFLAMLAHELRNPLSPILSAAQLMRMPGVDQAIAERAGGIVQRQVERMIRIVEDLLDVSRVSRGRIQIRPESVDVATAVERAVESCQPLLAARHHELSWVGPSPPLAVRADPVRFEQMLTNLLTNAAKYTSDHGRIELSARADGEFVEVAVRDNGIGIAVDMLDSIFELFMQVDDSLSRSEGGLGIGLPLVRQLAEIHGGTVVAYSLGRGKGAEFVLRLPSATASATAIPQEADARRSRALRILLVDDNVDVVEMIASVLERKGHVVKLLHDGPTAIAEAPAFAPDVAFLDIGLPGCDGYEVARHLRREIPSCRLIAVSGYGRAEDKARAVAAGFTEHVVKPITFEVVERILGAS